MELSETFWAGFYTFTGGFILAVLALMYKSKCDQLKFCWGCMEVHRNVEVEMAEDLRQIQVETPQPVD
jgi:hypothetical protein